MKIRLFKTVLILCILVCCVTLAGCGCGKKKTDPASEQVLKISITPTPSPTPEPEQVDSAAVTTNGDVTMVNIYAAENPGVTQIQVILTILKIQMIRAVRMILKI